MKKKLRKFLLIFGMPIVGFAIYIVGFAIYLGVTTFKNTGDDAIAKMSKSEKVFLNKIMEIKPGMSYQDVEVILGTPDRNVTGLRPTWRVNGSPFNQVAVYMGLDGVRHVRWMKIGTFIYEHK